MNGRTRNASVIGGLAALAAISGAGTGTLAGGQAIDHLGERITALEKAQAVDENEREHVREKLSEVNAAVASNAETLEEIDGKLTDLILDLRVHMAHPTRPARASSEP